MEWDLTAMKTLHPLLVDTSYLYACYHTMNHRGNPNPIPSYRNVSPSLVDLTIHLFPKSKKGLVAKYNETNRIRKLSDDRWRDEDLDEEELEEIHTQTLRYIPFPPSASCLFGDGGDERKEDGKGEDGGGKKEEEVGEEVTSCDPLVEFPLTSHSSFQHHDSVADANMTLVGAIRIVQSLRTKGVPGLGQERMLGYLIDLYPFRIRKSVFRNNKGKNKYKKCPEFEEEALQHRQRWNKILRESRK